MRYTLLFILLPLLAFCQFADTTMQINISIPAPTEVVEQIDTLKYYIGTFESNPGWMVGMPIESMGLYQTTQTSLAGLQTSYGLVLPADGSIYGVAVFALDSQGNELIYTTGYDRYFLRSGVAVGQLPLQQTITDHDVYIQVNVTFQ